MSIYVDCGTTMFTDEIIHSALQQHFPDVDVNELTGKSYGAISTRYALLAYTFRELYST